MGHQYPPQRVLFHIPLLGHLAAASADGVAAGLEDYRACLGEDGDLPLARRLAGALLAVLVDLNLMRGPLFAHEKGRGIDTSRFRLCAGSEYFEKPAPTPSDDAARLEYVLRLAKRKPKPTSAPSQRAAEPDFSHLLVCSVSVLTHLA